MESIQITKAREACGPKMEANLTDAGPALTSDKKKLNHEGQGTGHTPGTKTSGASSVKDAPLYFRDESLIT